MTVRFRELMEKVRPRWDETKPLTTKNPKEKLQAQGEKDFADQHGEPEIAKETLPGNADVLNASKAKKTNMHGAGKELTTNGDRSAPTQGNSAKLSFNTWNNSMGKAPTKQTNSPGRGSNLSNGDTKIIRLSPTAVDPSKNNGIQEGVFINLPLIAEDNEDYELRFRNGELAIVSPATAQRLLTIESKLSKPNSASFRRKLDESPENMMMLLSIGGK